MLKEGATYQLGLSDELIKCGVNQSFHASLLRPHVPNDDRCFPRRLPIQIPGFGEKPKEWIVDRIVTHHGKGMGSEFQILWKAGDKMWAPYCEVAHLNALDRYCKLMGVKEASGLLSNYVNKDVDSEDNTNLIQVKACTIEDKRRDNLARDSLILSTSSTIPPTSPTASPINFKMRNLSIIGIRECLDYKRALNASHSLHKRIL